MKRPKIKDFFHEKTDLEIVHSEYTKSPHLYSYASALDRYIDEKDNEINELKRMLKEVKSYLGSFKLLWNEAEKMLIYKIESLISKK